MDEHDDDAAQPPQEHAEPAEPAMKQTDVEPAEADATCPSCGAHAEPGARFCEECGSSLEGGAHAPGSAAALAAQEAAAREQVPVRRACVRCGGEVADDGYCTECGAPAASERDHFVVSASPTVGGVCDRGVVHRRNEDAMAIDVVDGVALLIVCDGVSSAPASDVASLAASNAALGLVAEGAAGGSREVTALGPARTSAWGSLLVEAAGRANAAVLEVPTAHEADAPSCTYVAAVADGPLVVVASVGDSRAYWLPDSGRGVRLSIDDSWVQEMVELGMSASQAEGSPHAHAITRWLGADAPELAPRTDTVTVTSPGWLLLCSDGLWNYCSDADALAELVRSTLTGLEEDSTASDLAGALVEWANSQGGRDNVTVALARLG